MTRSQRTLRSGRQAVVAAVVAAAAATAGAAAGRAVAVTSQPALAGVERELFLMGTRLRLAIAATDRATAERAAEAAIRALEATEARLSTWRDDSELARLNRAPVGTSHVLSPALASELEAALRCSTETGEAFDPGVGALVALWDLRGAGRVPAAAEIAATLPASRAGALTLAGGTAVRRDPGLRLDEGGFGKGAGLDEALAAAARAGAREGWIDLGGQTALLGAGPWPLEVAHPDHRERPVVALELDRGSLATSGNGERGLRVGDVAVGHLLDPRTGRPAPDFGSVSVWAENALAADCLATGLYVLGPEAALAWAASRPEVAVLVLERRAGGLLARASANLAGRVRALAREVELSFGGAPAASAGR